MALLSRKYCKTACNGLSVVTVTPLSTNPCTLLAVLLLPTSPYHIRVCVLAVVSFTALCSLLHSRTGIVPIRFRWDPFGSIFTIHSFDYVEKFTTTINLLKLHVTGSLRRKQKGPRHIRLRQIGYLFISRREPSDRPQRNDFWVLPTRGVTMLWLLFE